MNKGVDLMSDELEQNELRFHAEIAVAFNQELKELELAIINDNVNYLPRFDA